MMSDLPFQSSALADVLNSQIDAASPRCSYSIGNESRLNASVVDSFSVAWWPHTTDTRVASFRLRCRQVVSALRARRVRSWIYLPGAAVPRVMVLSKRYDEQTLAHALDLKARSGMRIVLDLCDNHFFVPEDDSGTLRRRADQLRHAVRSVDTVITSSVELARAVTDHCPGVSTPSVVPDAVELPHWPSPSTWLMNPRLGKEMLQLSIAIRSSGVPMARRLLWFGSHGSPGIEGGMSDLARIREPLERACSRSALWLTVVSNRREKYRELLEGWAIPSRYVPWRIETFSRIARWHSAAVIPISPNPFTNCKTNNRLATAFIHGLNVIADCIPSYEEFSSCAVLNSWVKGLGEYLEDSDARASHLVTARHLLDHYSLSSVTDGWCAALGVSPSVVA